eukprot:GHVS01101741.1.p1 GENE.GHVS01101741.1~~GHVS01101741.1.p1  ORF type:complete len:105 (+),score=8.33 GHVS01101741.1:479-793(+)
MGCSNIVGRIVRILRYCLPTASTGQGSAEASFRPLYITAVRQATRSAAPSCAVASSTKVMVGMMQRAPLSKEHCSNRGGAVAAMASADWGGVSSMPFSEGGSYS